MNVRDISFTASLIASLARATSADAQSRAYAGVVAGPYYTDADHVSGTLIASGVTAGVSVLPWLDVEVDLLRPAGELTREYTGPSISFAGAGAARDQFVVTRFINERRASMVFSVGASFHPRVPIRRMTPRLFVGIANHRVRDRTVLEHLSLPPGVTIEQVNRALPPADWRTRSLGGLAIGGSLAVEVTPHLSIAPDVRYDYGSIGDEINNALRTSVRALWRF